MFCWWVSWTPPFRLPASPPPLHTTMFPCIALVMSFSRDTLSELSMTLVRLSGAKSLRHPVVSHLLGEWVASSPLARARWSDATLAMDNIHKHTHNASHVALCHC